MAAGAEDGAGLGAGLGAAAVPGEAARLLARPIVRSRKFTASPLTSEMPTMALPRFVDVSNSTLGSL